jgi:hypothetical protein
VRHALQDGLRNTLEQYAALVPNPNTRSKNPTLDSLVRTCPLALLDALKAGLGVHYSGYCEKMHCHAGQVTTAYLDPIGSLRSLELPHIICMLSIINDRRAPDAPRQPFTSRGVTLTLNNIAQALRFRWVIGDGQPAPRVNLSFYQVGRTGLGHDMRHLPAVFTRAADDTLLNCQKTRRAWYFTKEAFPFYLGEQFYPAAESDTDTTVLTDLAFPHQIELHEFLKDRLDCTFDCSRLAVNEPLQDRDGSVLALFTYLVLPPLLCHVSTPHQADSLLVHFHAGATLSRALLRPARTQIYRYLHHWQHQDLTLWVRDRAAMLVRTPLQPASPLTLPP